MKLIILIFAVFCLALKLAMDQSPPLPRMDRQLIWVQPNPEQVTGYRLIWGTNVLQVQGSSNTTAVVKLAEGVNKIIIQAAGTNGTYSDPITNIVRLINYEFQESTNGSTWVTQTNFTYAIGDYKPASLFRVKLNWIAP